jgi:hypothetical protein
MGILAEKAAHAAAESRHFRQSEFKGAAFALRHNLPENFSR